MFVTVNYNVVTFESSLTAEQLHAVKRYKPEALVLKKDKDPIFALEFNPCANGSVNGNGIVLDSTAATKKAFTSIQLYGIAGEPIDEKRAEITERFGVILAHANKVEEQCRAALEEVNATLESVADSIIIA